MTDQPPTAEPLPPFVFNAEVQRIMPGNRVYVRNKPVEGLNFKTNADGNGTVRLHWHYEGCMFDVDMDAGNSARICPKLGDTIELLDHQEQPSVLALSTTVYQS